MTRVWVRGEILTASAFDRLARGCDELYKRLEGWAWLDADEPALRVLLAAANQHGHVSIVVEITPDHPTQSHHFEFDIDQSYLPTVASQCRTLLRRFPNRILTMSVRSNVSLLLTSDLRKRLRRNGDTSLAAELGR